MPVLTRITSRSLADNAVSSAKIQDGAIAVADVADGSISTAKLADDAVTTAKIGNDQVTAAKIPAGAVVADVGAGGITATQLATDAVITAKIQNDAVDADKLASNAVVTASIVDANITSAKMAAGAIEVKPHIIPGVLQPAVAGKDLSGTSLPGTYSYGTAHTDGHSYFYTDIKGSKPIKDPRIGAHFGSQRHKIKSMQLLKHETSVHDTTVYSVDGREWFRFVGSFEEQIGSNGHQFRSTTGSAFLEITGYFNQFNFLEPMHQSGTARNRWIMSVDGTATVTESSNPANQDNPMSARYVDNGSLRTFATGVTQPRIITIRLTENSVDGNNWMSAIELISQDTTSTANKSKIQIPAQNVVSYGKKYSLSAATPHYDPFNGFTNGNLAAVQALGIDDTTSLGLGNWLHSGSYYRPYNGARVVKWVNSSGVIKTSVTIMPPNSQNILGSSISAKANAAVANDTYLPTFSGAIDHSLAEEAKTIHFREFGNGGANGGHGISGGQPLAQSGIYADFSALTATKDDAAFVLDDGITGFFGHDVHLGNSGQTFVLYGADDYYWITWIGTGFSFTSEEWGAGTHHVVQNLPYGSHMLRCTRDADAHPDYLVDGVPIVDPSIGTYGSLTELMFHQPKMPPIPEDACILADYMLMADYKKRTATGSDISTQISKGVRMLSAIKDHLWNSSSAFVAANSGVSIPANSPGIKVRSENNDTTAKLPFFGTNIEFAVEGQDQAWTATLGGSGATEEKLDNTAASYQDHITLAETLTLGLNETILTCPANYNLFSTHVASPIHTSHHYKSFETQFANELVCGDQNMEQRLLICSADGKTWEQVTRDMSYIGFSAGAHVSRDGGNLGTASGEYFWDLHRGADSSGQPYYHKGFAPAVMDIICLENGTYRISGQGYTSDSTYDMAWYLRLNGTTTTEGSCSGDNTRANHWSIDSVIKLKRGDRISLGFAVGAMYGSGTLGQGHDFCITKV